MTEDELLVEIDKKSDELSKLYVELDKISESTKSTFLDSIGGKIYAKYDDSKFSIKDITLVTEEYGGLSCYGVDVYHDYISQYQTTVGHSNDLIGYKEISREDYDKFISIKDNMFNNLYEVAKSLAV